MANNEYLIDPPGTITVNDRRVVLYTHDERPIVRQAGFRGAQTTGVNPPLSDNTQRRPKPKKAKR